MANQLAILSWTAPGDEIILYDKCHITAMENGAIGALAGVQARTIDSETGILTPEEGKSWHIQSSPTFENKRGFSILKQH